MNKFVLCLLLGSLSLALPVTADQELDAAKKEAPSHQEEMKEEKSESHHKIVINGKEIAYKATAGTMILKGKEGKDKASVFYVSYEKEGEFQKRKRPIAFCFNGGPGSSSIWLHMGTFGPRTIKMEGKGYPVFPYELIDNNHSILDLTDLVFIDPVSTGYSRAAPGEDPKQFHGVDQDIESVAEFIRLYTTRNSRWCSPKFLAGESYGTTRAAGLAAHLHDEHHMYLNGVILLSSVLNFQTLCDYNRGNDLPYMLFLPTYTAAAWYHHKLTPYLQNKSLPDVLREVELFALNDYSQALLKGRRLSGNERLEVVKKLSYYTGLSPEYIRRANLRINALRFSRELLREEGQTVGRFDARFKGKEADDAGEYISEDPSSDAVSGGFAATFNHYIREELKWEKDNPYKVISSEVRPWDYGASKNEYLNVGEALRDVMTRNPHLKVFIGSSYYDLATPYFATEYTIDHLGLDPTLEGHIKTYYYNAGHMMYIDHSSLEKLKRDLKEYIEKSHQASSKKN